MGFEGDWFDAERHGENYWRWTGGAAELVFENRNAETVVTQLNFTLNAISKRIVNLTRGDEVLWSGEVASRDSEDVVLDSLKLEPGKTLLRLESSLPPSGADNDDRLLDMSVKNLRLDVKR